VKGCRFNRRWISADLGLFFEHRQKSKTQNAHRIAATSLDEIRYFKLAIVLPFRRSSVTLKYVIETAHTRNRDDSE